MQAIASRDVTTTVVRSRQRVEEIAGSWHELLETCATGTVEVYNTPDYLLTMAPGDPFVITVEQNDKLAAVLPFYLEKTRFTLRVSVLSVLNIQARRLRFVPFAPVFSQDCDRQQAWDTIRDILQAHKRAFDFLFLECVPEDSEMLRELGGGSAILPSGSRQHRRGLRLPQTFDEYVKGLDKKVRYTLRNAQKKFSEGMGASPIFHRITAPDQVPEFLRDVQQVFSRSWQSATFGARQRDSDTMVERTQQLAHAGLLRSYVMECSGRPIAFVIGYQFRGTFHYEEIGYDQQFAEHTPGSVLLHHVLEDLFASDKPVFLDFGAGDAVYKKQFGNEAVAACSAYLTTSATWRTILNLQGQTDRFVSRAKSFSAQLGLESKLRKLLKRKKA